MNSIMRALLLIAFLSLIFKNTQAQGFKTSLLLSPGISWYRSNSNSSEIEKHTFQENKRLKFSFSGGIGVREEYFFSKIFSLGMEFRYLYTNGLFYSYYSISNIPEIHSRFRHLLSVNSLDIPVFFRLRTKSEVTKGISFYFGTGLSWVMNADRDIVIESGHMGSPPTEIMSVANGSVKIKNENNNQIGTVGIVGIGKHFAIKNKTFFCEIKYRFDLNNWVYPTVGDPVNSSFDIKRRCLLLNLGITL